MLADLRWLGLEWDEGPDKEGEVRKKNCCTTCYVVATQVLTLACERDSQTVQP